MPNLTNYILVNEKDQALSTDIQSIRFGNHMVEQSSIEVGVYSEVREFSKNL